MPSRRLPEEEVGTVLSRSEALSVQARRVIPGGVNSALRSIIPSLVFVRATRSKIYDADDKEYIDHHLAFGPIILGHCHPEVNRRVSQTLETIDLIGAGATQLEIDLAARIVQHIPSAESVLFCNTGTEATYHALRLARAVTGRRRVIKFQGCYHGWHDYVLMNFITPPDRMGRLDPGSTGMLQEAIESTTVLRFNDTDELERTIGRHGADIAAVIIEPIAHNVGTIMPAPGFLPMLRALTRDRGIVLIFDEVITGFRHNLGGYQAICGVMPDLTTVGKAMANGYPLAALVGRRDFMSRFTTAGGDVAYAGTYNAHPLGVSAAMATLDALQREGVYAQLFAEGDRLRMGLADIVRRLGIRASVSGFGSVWTVYFMDGPIVSYDDLLRNDTTADLAFRRELIARGIFCLPSPLKRNHLCAAHTPADIDKTLEAAESAFLAVR